MTQQKEETNYVDVKKDAVTDLMFNLGDYIMDFHLGNKRRLDLTPFAKKIRKLLSSQKLDLQKKIKEMKLDHKENTKETYGYQEALDAILKEID